jgi:hypothetical protein
MTEYNKYNDAKIYKLSSSVDDEFYVGSTINTLNRRFYDHKSLAKSKHDRPIYKHFNNIGWDKVSISLVCDFKCNTMKELLQEEDRHIVLLKPSLNLKRASRSSNEYYQDNKDKIKAYKHQDDTKARYKEYVDTNKDLITKQRKDWHDKNIDRVKAVRNAVIQCECGKTYTHANVLRHKNSVFHTKFIQEHITI